MSSPSVVTLSASYRIKENCSAQRIINTRPDTAYFNPVDVSRAVEGNGPHNDSLTLRRTL